MNKEMGKDMIKISYLNFEIPTSNMDCPYSDITCVQGLDEIDHSICKNCYVWIEYAKWDDS